MLAHLVPRTAIGAARDKGGELKYVSHTHKAIDEHELERETRNKKLSSLPNYGSQE